jgi:hypothetical protein
MGPETKNDYAGEGQQQISVLPSAQDDSKWLAVEHGSSRRYPTVKPGTDWNRAP